MVSVLQGCARSLTVAGALHPFYEESSSSPSHQMMKLVRAISICMYVTAA